MIPIVRIPGDFILTEYRDPTWQIIEETIDSVKEVILCIYCQYIQTEMLLKVWVHLTA